MMHPEITLSNAPIPPALIASLFDHLALVLAQSRLQRTTLTDVARAIGCSDAHLPALLARIRVAEILLRDPRWPPWSQYFKSCSPEAHRALDQVIVSLIAQMPLTSARHFPPDRFFNALLATARQCSRC